MAGILSISKTGTTKLGVRISHDIDDSAPTWGSTDNDNFQFYCTDYGSLKPTLTINYSTGDLLMVSD